MEITAKVIARLPKRSGTSAKGNQWASQEYVVEYNYDTQYPKKAVLQFFGEEKVNEAQQLLHKDTIAVFKFDINAREITKTSGEKMWFQSLECYNVAIPQSAPVNNVAPQPAPTPQPTNNVLFEEEQSDELPF